ncbi:MAG: O-antigen ligase family protein [Acidobacteriota bacterium]
MPHDHSAASSAMKPSYALTRESAVALALGGLAVAGVILCRDWRVAAVFGGLFAVAILTWFPFFGLMLVVAVVFIGTPSLTISHARGVVTHLFPAMLLLPPVLLGFLVHGAVASRPAVWRPPSLTPLTPFIAAVVALHLLGLVWAPHTLFAVGQLVTLGFDALLFFAVVAAVSNPGRLQALAWATVLSGVLVCAAMFCGVYYDWAGTLHLARGVELNFELFSEERWGRIGGLCSANQAGGFLVLATFQAIGLSRVYRRWRRVGLSLLPMLFLTFVVVSGSRGAILGFCGAAGAFMLFHPATRRLLLSRSALLVLVLAGAILAGKPSFIDRMLVGFGYSGPLIFTDKKKSDSAANVSGSGARFRMWKDALSVMADQPELMLLGLGPGGFIWHTREPEVHSLWLAFFFDLGLPGGLAGILGLATLSVALAQALKRTPPGPARTLFVAGVVGGLAELGIHSLIDHDLTSPVSRFPWLYLAIVAAALQVVRKGSELTLAAPMENAHAPLPVRYPDPWPAAPDLDGNTPVLSGPACAANVGQTGPGHGRAGTH